MRCLVLSALFRLLLAAGIPLDEVECEAEFGLDFAQKANFGLVSPMWPICNSGLSEHLGARPQHSAPLTMLSSTRFCSSVT